MKLGIVLSSNDPESVWSAFVLGTYSLAQGDDVRIYLVGKGVEAFYLEENDMGIKENIEFFLENGGELVACGTCVDKRGRRDKTPCSIGSAEDLYNIVSWAEKIVSF